jgi:acyl-CoA synthetase (AMP-forming)/AMP-acid ligase II
MVSAVARGRGYRSGVGEDGASTLTMGRLEAGGEMLVVDPDTRQPLPDGRIGELWLRGPSVAAGYWGQDDSSCETFAALTADGSGPFLRTGDLGFVRGGELFVTGRRKELIIVRGRKHSPSDLESTVEHIHFDSPHHRAGGSAAFCELRDGEERVFIAIEIERRQAERRAGAAPGVERRRGKDRRNRPFAYKPGSTPASVCFDDVVRSIRNAITTHHGVEVSGVFLMRPGSIPKTSSGKKQRLQCRELLSGGLRKDVLHQWRGDLPEPSLLAPRVRVG